ncbi:MAG: hypothetical protein ACRENN_08630 [Candidatus Eiseniibacteriota bacterium]
MNSPARAVTAALPARPRVRVAARPPARVRYTIYALFTAAWSVLFWYGFGYYKLDLADRLRSPLHGQLRPSGEIGLLYGYLGTAVLLLLLLYSIRKRVRVLHGLGKLGRWLNVHIFFGIAGPLMITLHAGFHVTGAIAVGYWAMMCVMLSGFVGYYLLRQVGGALSETEDSARILTEELEALDRELTDRFQFTPSDLQALRFRSGIDQAAEWNAVASLFYLLGHDILGALDSLGLMPKSDAEKRLRPFDRRVLRALTRRHLAVERRRAFLRQTSALFHYWHTIHKPFTFVLFIMMGIHIGVAFWLGYALPRP